MRPTSILAGLLPAGEASTEVIRTGIDALHPRGWPTQAYRACAVRLRDGALVVFGSDGAPSVSIGTAVAASCAIPSWFAPVDVGGERYIDGGAHSFTNASEAASIAPDLVVISAPMARLAGRAQLGLEVQSLRRRGIDVVTFRPSPEDERAMGLNAMDPSKRAPVVRAVRETARRRVESLRDRLEALG